MSTQLIGAIGVEQPEAPEQLIAPAFAYEDYEIPPALTSEESLALEYGFALSEQESILVPPEPAFDFRQRNEEPAVELSGPYDPAIESFEPGVSPSSNLRDEVAPSVEVDPVATDDRDAQLAQLLERLAYYEAFDSLIHDNISRSADLLRSLYEERERIRSEAAGSRAEIEASATLEAERSLFVERKRVQSTLKSMMDDANGMQRQVDGLIRRIADAITASDSSLGWHTDEPVEGISA